jgi:hypothetical protein
MTLPTDLPELHKLYAKGKAISGQMAKEIHVLVQLRVQLLERLDAIRSAIDEHARSERSSS